MNDFIKALIRLRVDWVLQASEGICSGDYIQAAGELGKVLKTVVSAEEYHQLAIEFEKELLPEYQLMAEGMPNKSLQQSKTAATGSAIDKVRAGGFAC